MADGSLTITVSVRWLIVVLSLSHFVENQVINPIMIKVFSYFLVRDHWRFVGLLFCDVGISMGVYALLDRFKERVFTNKRIVMIIGEILAPILKTFVLQTNPAITEAWNARTQPNGYGKTYPRYANIDVQYFGTFVENNKSLVISVVPHDISQYAADLKEIRNKAAHPNSNTYVTNDDVVKCFAAAMALIGAIQKRRTATGTKTLKMRWGLLSLQDWLNLFPWETMLRALGLKWGRYDHATSSLTLLNRQWLAERVGGHGKRLPSEKLPLLKAQIPRPPSGRSQQGSSLAGPGNQ